MLMCNLIKKTDFILYDIWNKNFTHIYPYDSIRSWKLAVITTTICSTTNEESLKVSYPCIKSWNKPGDISLPSQTVQVFSNPITIMGLIIHTHTSTKLRHSAVFRSEGKLSNPSGSKRNSWAYFPSSFHLIKTRNKNIKP